MRNVGRESKDMIQLFVDFRLASDWHEEACIMNLFLLLWHRNSASPER